MLNSLISWAANARSTVLVMYGTLIAIGLTIAVNLAVDAVPDVTNVQVMVIAKTGALDPEQVEKRVTYYVETELAGIPKIEEIRSVSRYGISFVVIVFTEGTNIYWARQQIAERLPGIQAKMPRGITPEMGPISTGLGEVVMYTLYVNAQSPLMQLPEKERLIELRTYQDYVIRPEIKKVYGVAEVDSNGGHKKEIHIDIFPQKMVEYGITFEELIRKVESLGENYGGGYIQKDGNQLIVRTVGVIPNLNDLANVPVKLSISGRPIRLRDIAEVSNDAMLRVGAATYKGEEAVLGIVMMRAGENSRIVSSGVVKALNELKLPEGMAIEILYSRDFLVNATLKTVAKNLGEGAVLVILILFLILGNIRAALIVAVSVPVSMIFATSGMQMLGISGNLMSLGAIDFGLLVDASVVMVENFIRRLEPFAGQKIDAKTKLRVLTESCHEIAKPVTTGLIIIMLVYVPILALEGVEGKMFGPMAKTVIMALAASLSVALILMPVLMYYFLNPPAHAHHEPFLFRVIDRAYKPLLHFSLNHRNKVLIPAGIFSVVSFLLFRTLGSDFVPKLDEGDMVIVVVRDNKIGIRKAIEDQKRAERQIMNFPEVEKVYSRIGASETATDPAGVNMGDMFVILKKDRSGWRKKDGRQITKTELYQLMIAAIKNQNPEDSGSLTQPIEMRFNEMLEGSRADITLRIFGNDLNKLEGYIDKARSVIEKIPGALAVDFDPLTALKQSPVLDAELDHRKMALYDIDIKTANTALEVSMSGQHVGSYYENNFRFPIVVIIDEKLRDSVEQIKAIPVGLPEGGAIPLSSIANIEQTEQVTTIARYFSKRYAAIGIYLKDRDIKSFVLEAQQKVDSALKLPFGYSTYWGGQFKNLERASARLAIIVPITLALIFILIYRIFRNFKDTILIYLCIPFAMTGGFLSLWIRQINFSVSAAVGFIALAGIAVLNANVLVSFFTALKSEGKSIREAVTIGAMARLRPVVMTAMVASLGFTPMALNTGLGAEVQRPLATVVIGGLITSTMLTLLLLPTLYLWIYSRNEKLTTEHNYEFPESETDDYYENLVRKDLKAARKKPGNKTAKNPASEKSKKKRKPGK